MSKETTKQLVKELVEWIVTSPPGINNKENFEDFCDIIHGKYNIRERKRDTKFVE